MVLSKKGDSVRKKVGLGLKSDVCSRLTLVSKLFCVSNRVVFIYDDENQ